ncbi:MAG: C25 family cysteine peptidase [Thermoplasmatota archaeon]
MKKVILIVLVGILVLSGLQAGALFERHTSNLAVQKTESIFVSAPMIIESETYISVELDEATSFLINDHEPILPRVTKYFILPVGSTVLDASVEFSGETTQILSNKIHPAPEPIIGSMDHVKPLQESSEIYETDALYPEETYTYRIASGRYKDQGHVMFVIFNCYPVRYNPVKNELVSYENIEITVTYKEPTAPAQTISEDEYDLLIIAPSKFAKEVEPLVSHKKDHGMATKLVTVEEIYAEYTQGRDDPENIKLFIKDEFDNYDITYVLFVGGQIGQTKQWYIPVRTTNNYAGSPFEYGVDSDLYYADLYKENGTVFECWDSNENDIFAEYMPTSKDIIDGIPDVFVGRLACRNLFEVRTVVRKIINYEQTRADDSWFKNMLLIAGDTYPDAGEPDAYEGEIYTDVSASYMDGFSFQRLWASTGALTGQKVVVDAINNGAGFIHMAGHANPSVLVTHPPRQKDEKIVILQMYNFFKPLNINPKLRNRNMLPVVVIGGCHNSQFNVSLRNFFIELRDQGSEYFDYDFYKMEWVPKCFSWWLVSRPNGGSIIAIGNTGLGMGLPGYNYPNGLNGWLLPRFFYNYGQEGIEYAGAVHSAAITDYALEFDINTKNTDRQMLEQWPLLGDPSLLIGGYN